MKFTAAEKRECAERELAMRRRAYPRWIEARRMTQSKADREIAMMMEIIEDYRATEAPGPALPLFQGPENR